MNSQERAFADLSADERVHHLFDLAYTASELSAADEYSETEFLAIQERSRDALEAFSQEITAERHKRRATKQHDRRAILHTIAPEANLEGTYYYLRHPEISFEIVSLRGIDAAGQRVIADRLSVLADPEVPDSSYINLTRGNYSGETLYPQRGNYPIQMLVNVCARLELVNQEQ